MKRNSFWKALGIAAIAAAVPVRVKKDEATGKKTFQSLLYSLDVGPGEGENNTEIGFNLLDGVIPNLLNAAKKESELFTDDPEEAVLFADDEPQAAVVEPIEFVEAEEAKAEAEEVKAEAEEVKAEAEEVKAEAEEVKAEAEEVKAEAEEIKAEAEEIKAEAEEVKAEAETEEPEATEEDFDPDL